MRWGKPARHTLIYENCIIFFAVPRRGLAKTGLVHPVVITCAFAYIFSYKAENCKRKIYKYMKSFIINNYQ
jgi:hypothetical protein